LKLISQLGDLKAVSGGYIQDEFVTANTIYYHSILSAVCVGFLGGMLGVVAGAELGSPVGPVLVGLLGVAAGAKFGFYNNEYADIEPDTWVRWDVTVVYY